MLRRRCNCPRCCRCCHCCHNNVVPNYKPSGDEDSISFIKIYNFGVFDAYFSVRYITQGRIETQESIDMPYFVRYPIYLPEDATNIILRVYVATFIKVWYQFHIEQVKEKPQNCYELYGTIFSPQITPMKCPGYI